MWEILKRNKKKKEEKEQSSEQITAPVIDNEPEAEGPQEELIETVEEAESETVPAETEETKETESMI